MISRVDKITYSKLNDLIARINQVIKVTIFQFSIVWDPEGKTQNLFLFFRSKSKPEDIQLG